MVLRAGGDPSFRNADRRMNAFMMSAECGNLESLRVLLPVSDLAATDIQGRDALKIARESGLADQECVNFLEAVTLAASELKALNYLAAACGSDPEDASLDASLDNPGDSSSRRL